MSSFEFILILSAVGFGFSTIRADGLCGRFVNPILSRPVLPTLGPS